MSRRAAPLELAGALLNFIQGHPPAPAWQPSTETPHFNQCHSIRSVGSSCLLLSAGCFFGLGDVRACRVWSKMMSFPEDLTVSEAWDAWRSCLGAGISAGETAVESGGDDLIASSALLLHLCTPAASAPEAVWDAVSR